jgi:lipid-A-disaccharide synthase
MNIVLVAGEASGDQLGAALMRAIRLKEPGVQFAGIGGPLMKDEGCDCWWDTSVLSLMGLVEVISHLPRLIKLRRQLVERVVQLKPDVFIGIDAPDFNMGVEKRLKARDIPVIQYGSPTIWAWRSYRVKKIVKSTDRVLCLFPFEPDCYQHYPIAADYTGHPMADQIPLQVPTGPAREALGLDSSGTCIALLPGSRMAEVEKLSPSMLDAAEILGKRYPGTCFLIPAATQRIDQHLKSLLLEHQDLNCRIYDGQSKEVMAAADVVVCASGTATLEVTLINRPMVVCYRVATPTHRMMKWFKMLKTRFIALPNILAGESLVPELIQDDVSGQRIADEVIRWMDQPELLSDLRNRFDQLHEILKIDAAATAGDVVFRQIAARKA